ncbi:helix-hairpin-helix domain-containing protein [Fictibacillus fluitans]|uniref:Helix-hairpin-helix domain-containing protein n=1 Tax=Fictibacillus fluitans TaxID=3058422 RepID=A0ABT8HXF4_9BACL|nr:helix-hairpin-helix domain-containing protein [Fictibacillus sp. NE201]MDN4525460.1 helix-hairpin-helix domain-containing protein [Fictibacillus sp. NE201]
MLKNYDVWIRKLRYILPAALAVGIIVLYWYQQQAPQKKTATEELPLELRAADPNAAQDRLKAGQNQKNLQPAKIMLDIKGAVVRPGVYEMKEGDRVIDAVEKAGGFTKNAEQRSVNLSGKVKDEMLLYILEKGEEAPVPAVAQNMGNGAGQDGGSGQSAVNINTANDQELQTITGIGPSKAKAIITFREENGGFKTVEDLLDVPGIGEKSLENMRGQVTVE